MSQIQLSHLITIKIVPALHLSLSIYWLISHSSQGMHCLTGLIHSWGGNSYQSDDVCAFQLYQDKLLWIKITKRKLQEAQIL